ncbi:protein yadU [Salmonella enterica subsp. enterica]|nr:protein yadU [Salmonella enterica subsp. enterica]
MKIIRTLFLLLIAVYGGSVSARPMLKATFGSTTLYYGIGPSYADRAVILNSTVTTPDGVYYGSWKFSGMARKGATATLLSWTGPDPAPTIVLRDFDNSISKSNCKKPPSSWNGCGYYTVDITVQSDNYGCPWLAATHSTAEDLVSGKPIARRTRVARLVRRCQSKLLISPGIRTYLNRKQRSCLMPPVARLTARYIPI